MTISVLGSLSPTLGHKGPLGLTLGASLSDEAYRLSPGLGFWPLKAGKPLEPSTPVLPEFSGSSRGTYL